MEQWTTLMDGIDNLVLDTGPEPTELDDDQVFVKINCVSLNYRDSKIIDDGDFRSKYKPPSERIVPVSDASGAIIKVGKHAASQWRVGDRIVNTIRANHLTGPTRRDLVSDGIGIPGPGVLTDLPYYMSFEEASTLPIAAVTAWTALNWDQPIGNPIVWRDVVKLERARKIGADYTINYNTTSGWGVEVLCFTNGNGADIIVENGGPATLDQSLSCVAPGGNISVVGSLSGIADGDSKQKSELGLGMKLILRNAALKGINAGPKDRMEEMPNIVYIGKEIHLIVDRVFDFKAAKEAFKYLYNGSHFGKVVIKVA
ncbi:putative alcohol dehydrogenase [Bisporella sp. PMI_857]|nr:putative alcohol dehydrogenase [Bisporella sp. PMI_857]